MYGFPFRAAGRPRLSYVGILLAVGLVVLVNGITKFSILLPAPCYPKLYRTHRRLSGPLSKQVDIELVHHIIALLAISFSASVLLYLLIWFSNLIPRHVLF